jgi:signal transduction histidine kinase
VGVSEFKDAMERKFFNGFWERYDIEFFMFNKDSEPVLNYKNVPASRLITLQSIINKHSITSEIDSNIFFIKDFTSQYSYIIRQPIYAADSTKALLFCALKSKKIPEKIGFPRLLISSNAKVFESLENYSIAKYYNGKLVSHNGKFSYPSRDEGLTKNISNISGYFDSDGYNHYLLRRTERDSIVLSRQNHSTIQFFTSFSYLFSFYGLFLLIPIYVQTKKTGRSKRTLTLAIRIQVVLIGLVFIALVAFGWGCGLFVKNQYQDYTNELIREKIRSVETEIKQDLGEEEDLSISEKGNYLEYTLQKLATVFVTDINLYDRNGFLLASSRPKVYNIGLVSEQMNPTALTQLKRNKKSEYFHQEKIGNLDYLSGYIPFYGNDGQLLAYLNLQHFGQQKGFEDQIQQFLVAIMNVFILLLALSIIVAIFVSTWVTSPLRILQQNFAQVQLGKYNQPISYAANDEIGILVKDYNEKLEELAYAAQQLAQSERESAWREMAKQVAHEIKNPLTPMKLSLQQLQRVFNPNDPDSKAKLDKVSASIIEQIDALAKIANEFSNFAKMPKANEVNLDLIPMIERVVVVFTQEADVAIEFETELSTCWVHADKDLILRVFNNLLKNAIQAIPDNRKGNIQVRLTETDKTWLIVVQDNGDGIPEALQDKLFVPYFTTKSTGTGLGLAMVKQIVEMHGGKIWFETTDNGTSFWVELQKFLN